MKLHHVALLATATAVLACPLSSLPQVGAPSSPKLPPRPGLVAVVVPNRVLGQVQACPYVVHLVDVGAGKVTSKLASASAGLSSYLPVNDGNPKAGCTDKATCPRLTIFLAPLASQPLSSATSTTGDGGTTSGADPCAGNPVMEGGGGGAGLHGITDQQAIKIALEADASREAILTAQ